MMDFRFTFEDAEEAEITFTAFAETCRQLKVTLSKRPRKTAASAQAIELTNTVHGATPSTALNGHAEPKEEGASNTAPDNVVDMPAPKRGRGRPRKSESEAAKTEYAPEKLTVTVEPKKTVTLEELTQFARQLAAKGSLQQVTALWKEYGVRRTTDLKPEHYADVYRRLTAISLNDHIPH